MGVCICGWLVGCGKRQRRIWAEEEEMEQYVCMLSCARKPHTHTKFLGGDVVQQVQLSGSEFGAIEGVKQERGGEGFDRVD